MRNKKGQFSSPADKQISQKFEELLGKYLHSLQQQKSSTTKSTVDTRRREVRYWLAFCEHNDIDPLGATEADVRGYVQKNTDLADTTLSSYFTSVQSFYSIVGNDQADDQLELANGHPCTEITLKDDYDVYAQTSEYKRQHNLSPKEIDGIRDDSGEILAIEPGAVSELFNHVPGKTDETRLRNEIAIRLNWYTGCRSVEISRMKIDNIDWDNCSINIRSAKLNAKEHTDLIRRNVFFPEQFKFQLKRWVNRVRHAFSSAVEPGSGYVLCTTHSDRMQGAQINDIVKTAAKKAGIQRPLRPADPAESEEIKEWFVTTHRIRRSAISHWVNDLEEIALNQARRLAGHANIEQTIDYVEDDDEALAEDYRRAMGSLK